MKSLSWRRSFLRLFGGHNRGYQLSGFHNCSSLKRSIKSTIIKSYLPADLSQHQAKITKHSSTLILHKFWPDPFVECGLVKTGFYNSFSGGNGASNFQKMWPACNKKNLVIDQRKYNNKHFWCRISDYNVITQNIYCHMSLTIENYCLWPDISFLSVPNCSRCNFALDFSTSCWPMLSFYYFIKSSDLLWRTLSMRTSKKFFFVAVLYTEKPT